MSYVVLICRNQPHFGSEAEAYEVIQRRYHWTKVRGMAFRCQVCDEGWRIRNTE